MTLRSRITKTTLAGVCALGLSFSYVSLATVVHADDSTVSDPLVVVVGPSPGEPAPDPSPVDPAPDPSPVDPAPVVPPTVDPTPVDPIPTEPGPPVTAPVAPVLPPEPAAPQNGTGATGSMVVPSPAGSPAVQAPEAPLADTAGVEESAQPSETASPSPSQGSTSSAAPVPTAAPTRFPAAAATEIQAAAVAIATGSPLGVQIVTVLILLAAGFAYFRFLGTKSGTASARNGK